MGSARAVARKPSPQGGAKRRKTARGGAIKTALNAEKRGWGAADGHWAVGYPTPQRLSGLPLNLRKDCNGRMNHQAAGQDPRLTRRESGDNTVMVGTIGVVVEMLVRFRIDAQIGEQDHQKNCRRAERPGGDRARSVFPLEPE